MAPSLIPRKLLFGNPSKIRARLSPDGGMLSWLAPVDGVMNIWLAPVDAIDSATPLTRVTGRPIPWQEWSADGRCILFLNDLNGDENQHLFVVDAGGGPVRDVTPYAETQARMMLVSPELPGRAIVGLNDRDPSWHDLWSIHLVDGKRTRLFENSGQFSDFVFDWQGNLRLASRMVPERGGREWLQFENSEWKPWRFVPLEDDMQTHGICFNRAGTHFNMFSSVGRDTAALIRIDMKSGREEVLASDPRVDIDGVCANPLNFEVDAVRCEHVEPEWYIVNPQVTPAFDRIREAHPGVAFNITSASDDNGYWTVVTYSAKDPPICHLLDRASGSMRELYRVRPELASFELADMKGVRVKASDGLDLVTYVSLPPGEGLRPEKPLPMVLVVHGGPWARDGYGFDSVPQWLANRGYAVLQVNYRASMGFGKTFMNAGDREHAGKMHDDLIDAVEWAIAEGIADRSRVAIMGWSYGGYASFVGATFTPDVFCCAVPIVGITDLVTLLENTPPYWAGSMEHLYRRYADVRTEEGRQWLRARSPISRVGDIKKPMLIGHGANDVRCTLAQSGTIVGAMQNKGLDVTYVVYPDEGHGFDRPENNLSFFAIAEAFLARHLGGRCEPVGEDFSGSTHEIRAGGGFLPETASYA